MSQKRIPLTLVKQGKNGIKGLVFSRVGIIALMLIVQFGLLFFGFYKFESLLPHVWGGSIILTSAAVIYIINCPMSPNAKVTWLVLIAIVPVFGSLLFVYTKSDFGHRALKRRINTLTRENKNKILQNPATLRSLKEKDPRIASLAEYISRSGCYPVFDKTEVTYLPTGEDKLKALLEELEKAEKFIFLEYFIIDEGRMWGDVLEVLERKVKQGVDVRVIYDGTCEFTTLPHDFPKRLKKLGIHCKVFAPITPFVSTHYNYRDHRKIVVIDGKIAFCGGINLADEYINEKQKYGHWKDTAVMLKGDAVESFTLMFLQMWAIEGKRQSYDSYLSSFSPSEVGDGYVIPFADCPVDNDKTGERVYMDILNRATDYVHIMSPYLVIDAEMETAIKFAAERGVDVSLILPGIPDKKGAWALAKTHYRSLLDSGVKIYEYTPGFVHAKVFVADDREAVVGTINLDYRSLYHHFECAVYMAYTPCIQDIEKDFSYTLDKCRKVTYDTVKREKLSIKIRGMLLKIIAPLM
ncbi:MAG: cardiolipin synthase [Clostridia bacterium]|nr:cardiolipin synthase [Clostridia bacterium]